MSDTTPRIHAQSTIDGLAQIGRTRHTLMGIRYANGEGGDAAAQTAAATAAQAAQQQTTTTTDPKPPWGDDPTKFDPDKAWKLIQNIKGDLAETKSKTAAEIAAAAAKAAEDAQKATLAQFAKLLTGEGEPETDPAKLNASLTELKGKVTATETQLTEAQAAVKDSQRAFAVALLAPTLGADTTKLLTHEAFKNSIASVEPTDQAAIQAAITKAVQDTPTLKATPSRSGGGEHQGATVQSLEAQLKTAQEQKDWKETIRLKRAIADARAAQH